MYSLQAGKPRIQGVAKQDAISLKQNTASEGKEKTRVFQYQPSEALCAVFWVIKMCA